MKTNLIDMHKRNFHLSAEATHTDYKVFLTTNTIAD